MQISFATSQEEVREAQALRYRVFVDEFGARVASKVEGVDRDMFDAHCEHLLVRDNDLGDVVGCYRILAPHSARAIGGFYSDESFDLTRLGTMREQMVELGRTCVHPDYRTGATIALLWNGIGQFMRAGGYRYLIGSASVYLNDNGEAAAGVHQLAQSSHAAPGEWRVFPRNPLPAEWLGRSSGSAKGVPPLIKGYLRAGAYVCGDPSWDPDFNTADFFMLLPMAKLNERHAQHFMTTRESGSF